MHLTPAGFPSGIPGIGEDIDIAIQHAPHPLRHSILLLLCKINLLNQSTYAYLFIALLFLYIFEINTKIILHFLYFCANFLNADRYYNSTARASSESF